MLWGLRLGVKFNFKSIHHFCWTISLHLVRHFVFCCSKFHFSVRGLPVSHRLAGSICLFFPLKTNVYFQVDDLFPYDLAAMLSSRCLVYWLESLANTKIAIKRNLFCIQNEAISLVAMRSTELWLVKKNQPAVKPDSNGFSKNQKLKQKYNWTAKSTNL